MPMDVVVYAENIAVLHIQFGKWSEEIGFTNNYSRDSELRGLLEKTIDLYGADHYSLFAAKVQVLRERLESLPGLTKRIFAQLHAELEQNSSSGFVNDLIDQALFEYSNRDVFRELCEVARTHNTTVSSADSITYQSVFWRLQDASRYFHQVMQVKGPLPLRYETSDPTQLTAFTDGKCITLQSSLALFPSREVNTLVYVFLLAHELAHIGIGSFAIDWDSPEFRQIEQRLGKTASSFQELMAGMSSQLSPDSCKYLVNIAEDIRVESHNARRFPFLNPVAEAVYHHGTNTTRHPELLSPVGRLITALRLEIPRAGRQLAGVDGMDHLSDLDHISCFRTIQTIYQKFATNCRSGLASIYDSLNCTIDVIEQLNLLELQLEKQWLQDLPLDASDDYKRSSRPLIRQFNDQIESISRWQSSRYPTDWDDISKNLSDLGNSPNARERSDSTIAQLLQFQHEIELIIQPGDRIYGDYGENGYEEQVVRVVDDLPKSISQHVELLAGPQSAEFNGVGDSLNVSDALAEDHLSYNGNVIDILRLIEVAFTSHSGRSAEIFKPHSSQSLTTIHCVIDVSLSMEFGREGVNVTPAKLAQQLAASIKSLELETDGLAVRLYGSVAGGRQRVCLARFENAENLVPTAMGGFHMGAILRDINDYQIPSMPIQSRHIVLLITDAGPWSMQTYNYERVKHFWEEQSLCQTCSIRSKGKCVFESHLPYGKDPGKETAWLPTEVTLIDYTHARQSCHNIDYSTILVLDAPENSAVISSALELVADEHLFISTLNPPDNLIETVLQKLSL